MRFPIFCIFIYLSIVSAFPIHSPIIGWAPSDPDLHDYTFYTYGISKSIFNYYIQKAFKSSAVVDTWRAPTEQGKTKYSTPRALSTVEKVFLARKSLELFKSQQYETAISAASSRIRIEEANLKVEEGNLQVEKAAAKEGRLSKSPQQIEALDEQTVRGVNKAWGGANEAGSIVETEMIVRGGRHSN